MRAVKVEYKQTTEDPELADRFNRVLAETVEAIEEAGIKYAFIGGIASGGLGRPRSTHDIDIFVQPEDVELALRALAKRGFKTERTDPSWLYKGWKENILVDIIFKSKGEIYFDSEMTNRLVTVEFHGKRLKLVAPEDLLIIKAAAHSELTPGHWHDAIALLTHSNLDWDYMLKRARRAPRRILSLLLYAQSNDVWVPNHVIHELYRGIFGLDTANSGRQPGASPFSQSHPVYPSSPARSAHSTHEERVTPLRPPPGHPKSVEAPSKQPSQYRVAHLREKLAEDARTNELDIQIEQSGNKVLLRGDVAVADRRETAEQIARECFPECEIENQIRVLQLGSPTETEEVQ
jgi:predicted nucleotidyltransferase